MQRRNRFITCTQGERRCIIIKLIINLPTDDIGQSMFDEITAMRNGAEPGTKAAFEEITKEWEIEERKLAEEHNRN